MLMMNNDQQKNLGLTSEEQKKLNLFFKRKSGHKDFKLREGLLGNSNFYNVIDDDFELSHGYLKKTNNGEIVYNTNETDVPYIYYLRRN